MGKLYSLERKKMKKTHHSLLISVSVSTIPTMFSKFCWCSYKKMTLGTKKERKKKLHLGTSPEEFAVDVAIWEFRSHYVIAMS